MKRESRLWGVRLGAVAMTGVIAWLTLTPVTPVPPPPVEYADKLSHVLAFFLWSLLLGRAWRFPGWVVLTAAAVYGGAIEIVQPYVGRDGELADLAADMVGAGLGLWVARRLMARFRQSRRARSGG